MLLRFYVHCTPPLKPRFSVSSTLPSSWEPQIKLSSPTPKKHLVLTLVRSRLVKEFMILSSDHLCPLSLMSKTAQCPVLWHPPNIWNSFFSTLVSTTSHTLPFFFFPTRMLALMVSSLPLALLISFLFLKESLKSGHFTLCTCHSSGGFGMFRVVTVPATLCGSQHHLAMCLLSGHTIWITILYAKSLWVCLPKHSFRKWLLMC